MMKALNLFSSLFSFLLLQSVALAVTHHKLEVEVSPEKHFLKVVDQLTFAARDCSKSIKFNLHEGLNPRIISPEGGQLTFVGKTYADDSRELGVEHFELKLPCGNSRVTLTYEGVIFHKVTDPDDPYSRGTSDSPGLISEEGVVLSSLTFWYPQLENEKDLFVNFDLAVTSKNHFKFMSQGQKLSDNQFLETTPQEDIYLIGAAFSVYEQKTAGDLIISAYLRTPDEAMASKYLNVTEKYLERYSTLIGQYPYKKFDLVENFWDTGFGMPSFTLLGSNIIRLPFIINTSYPHEVLHDWWGNGVYVDYDRGNWCEGITAYMADHLMNELNKDGDTYRRDTLQKFSDFVNEKNDFPLTKFLNRYNAPTEAIGYGKALMFFHMLRMKLGDDLFKTGFAHFYQNNKFKKVSYAEIEKSLEAVSGVDLKEDFNQWTKRTGAPSLKILGAESIREGEGFVLRLKLAQAQKEDVFKMNIPIAVSLNGEYNAFQTSIEMDQKEIVAEFKFKNRPVFLQVDPEFDVFRRLAKDEVPAVLTMALGANKTFFVIPDNAVAEKKFIEVMSAALPKESSYKVVTESEAASLPAGSSIWVLGRENKLVNKFNESVKDLATVVGKDNVEVNGQQSSFEKNSFTLVSRDPKTENIMVFASANDQNGYEILANKLIHYGKYSFLVFAGENLVNKQKGIWKQNSSSMSIPVTQIDGTQNNVQRGKLKMREALVNE